MAIFILTHRLVGVARQAPKNGIRHFHRTERVRLGTQSFFPFAWPII